MIKFSDARLTAGSVLGDAMELANALGKGVYILVSGPSERDDDNAAATWFWDDQCSDAIDSDPVVVPCGGCAGVIIGLGELPGFSSDDQIVLSAGFACPGPLDFICQPVNSMTGLGMIGASCDMFVAVVVIVVLCCCGGSIRKALGCKSQNRNNGNLQRMPIGSE